MVCASLSAVTPGARQSARVCWECVQTRRMNAFVVIVDLQAWVLSRRPRFSRSSSEAIGFEKFGASLRAFERSQRRDVGEFASSDRCADRAPLAGGRNRDFSL
jgi:hypothetical protein